MARFRKMAPAAPRPVETQECSGEGAQQATLADVAAIVARNSVKPPPPVDATQSARYAALSRLGVQGGDPALVQRSMQEAARLQCLKPGNGGEGDRTSTRQIGKFLVWAAIDNVVDPQRAFTRARVDEYLLLKATNCSQGTIYTMRCILYGIGRQLQPQQFPRGPRATRIPERTMPTPMAEVERLQAMVPGLPKSLGRRLQTLLDLAYGAGARSPELKVLRGNAITSTRLGGQTIAVVTLPNNGGGVRQVPVLDEQASTRLLELSGRVGDGLALAPHTTTPRRNLVNAINNELHRHRLAKVSATGLRHRWMLDLAMIAPAALLFQLADISDLRFVCADRQLLPTYTPYRAAVILQENR